MTEQQTTELLRNATDRLSPDIAALVAGGLSRGQARRRRRRAGVALGAVAAAVVVAGAAALSHGGGPSSTVVDPAASSAPTPSSTPTSGPQAGAPRDLAIRAAAIPSTFASLLPGDVALAGHKENPMDGYDPRPRLVGLAPELKGQPGLGIIADFTWNGSWTRLAVAPTAPTAGDTAVARCLAEGQRANGDCVEQPDGGVLQETTMTGGPEDGGLTTRVVNYYTPDLWEVTVLSANSADGRSRPLTGAEPPLSLAQLADVARSDVWFE